jgi:hypothetical protein
MVLRIELRFCKLCDPLYHPLTGHVDSTSRLLYSTEDVTCWRSVQGETTIATVLFRFVSHFRRAESL